MYHANVAAAAKKAGVPIALHLDHGDSFDLAMQALRVGYTSIMIDGSKLEFEDNIALSKRVVDACRPSDIPVEAELGKVGGKEDDLSCDDPGYTDPDDAVRFTKETGISSLAVAIGTAHGIYKGEPNIAFGRLEEIALLVSVPLVLHGGSGIPFDQVSKAISMGVSKINVNTELQLVFADATRKYIEAGKDLEGKGYDPRKLLKPGADAIIAKAIELCEAFGSANKA